MSIIKYSLPDVLFGGKPIAKIEKEVRLTENIPQQPDTAFGYDYELSDGSVRAKLFRNAVLFLTPDSTGKCATTWNPSTKSSKPNAKKKPRQA